MGRFTEKQLILATIVVAILLSAGFGALIWIDVQAIYKNEITDQNPGAAEVSDPEEWGEKRKIQEIKRQAEAAQAEADLIPKREQDVIVYREIVARDAQILPDADHVNELAKTIDEFASQAGVHLKQVSDLSITPGGEAIKMMPIKLQLAGSFDQFLKFLNLFESMDRIINTRAFAITMGRVTGEGRERRAIHEIQLDLATYMYTSSAGLAKPVEIANYDKRKDDPVIQKLVRQQKAARVDKYQLKPRLNRRDPLVDPRRPGSESTATSDPADVQKQRDLVEKLKFKMEELKEDVRQEAVAAQEHKYIMLAQLRPMIDEKCSRLEAEITAADPMIGVPELKEAFHDDIVSPFETIKSQRKLIPQVLQIARKDVVTFLEKMRTANEARDYETAVKSMADFDRFAKGQQVAEDAQDVVAEMRAIAKDAKVMLDFLALHIQVSGLIIRPEGSMVIVNKKMRKVGDYVDPASRCKLKEIHEDKLVFELDGLEIEHQIEKK